jgi:hypothetical protein
MAMIPSTRQEMLYAGPATAADHRLKVQQQDRERAALRASELATQTSPARGAEERIRIWERLHALRLPSTAAHALVAIVAKQTVRSRRNSGDALQVPRERKLPLPKRLTARSSPCPSVSC